VLWSSTTFGTHAAAAPRIPQAQETKQAAKFREEIRKHNAGESSRVKVKLTNGTEVKGYISKIDESSFAVTNKKTAQATTISYSEVQKIQGPGLSKGAKIAIGIGVPVVAAVIVVAIALGQCKRSGYCR
jgi:hypothetical protein